MAQYIYDWASGNTLRRNSASSSGDTVTTVSSPSLIGGQSIKIDLDDGLYVAEIERDSIPDRYRVDGLASTDLEYLALVRSDDDSVQLMVYLSFDNDQVLLRTYLGGRTSTGDGDRTVVTLQVNETSQSGPSDVLYDETDQLWTWLRLRKRTDTWYGQLWAYGTPEPAGEACSLPLGLGSSSAYLDDGWWFVAASRSGGPASGIAYLDWLSMGTNGDPAPRDKLQDYYVKDGGLWKPVDTHYVRDGGVWKETEYHVRDGGVWKKVYG